PGRWAMLCSNATATATTYTLSLHDALPICNSQQNKLGMPLPAGTVRLYKKDDKGNQQFIGEDRIDHTPKDEDVRVKVGDAIFAEDRKSTRLNSSHDQISYAVFCLKKKKKN